MLAAGYGTGRGRFACARIRCRVTEADDSAAVDTRHAIGTHSDVSDNLGGRDAGPVVTVHYSRRVRCIDLEWLHHLKAEVSGIYSDFGGISLDDCVESLGSERGIITEVEIDVTLERAIGVERGPAAAAHLVALVGALP